MGCVTLSHKNVYIMCSYHIPSYKKKSRCEDELCDKIIIYVEHIPTLTFRNTIVCMRPMIGYSRPKYCSTSYSKYCFYDKLLHFTVETS